MDLLETLALFRLFGFRTAFTALATRAFSVSPSDGPFLAPWNLTRTAPPPRAVDQVDFMALDCASMTLQEFIL